MPGKGLEETRQLLLNTGQYGLWGRDHAVDLSGNVHDTHAIRTSDRGKAAPEIDLGNGAERNLDAITRSDAHRFQSDEALPLVFGIAQHHPYIVPAPLHALHFFSIERLAYLAAEIIDRKPERSGRWLDVELDFLLAGAIGIRNIEHAAVARQLAFQLPGRCRQLLDGSTAKLDFECFARRELVGIQRKLDRIRDRTDLLPPEVTDLERSELALRVWDQLERNLG